MRNAQKVKHYARRIAIILGLWIILTLLISSITFIMAFQENYPLRITEILTFEFLCITPWILSTPLIIWVARKYRLERKRFSKSLAAHFFTVFFVFIFHSVVQSYQVSVYFDIAFDWSYLKRDFWGFLDKRLMLYIGVILGVYTVDFYLKNRESKLREPRLKAKLNKARYQALLNKIQPTFLISTIDAVNKKSRTDPTKSKQMVTYFSDLLRIMLQNAYRDKVTIQEDLEAYHIYLNLLEIRLGIKIQKKTKIEDKCEGALVPSFVILIPVFEEIVYVNGKKVIGIESMIYKAIRHNNRIQIEIVIRDIKISSKKLEMHLGNAQFPHIRQRFKDRYGETGELQVHTFANEIRIDLKVPFTIQPSMEQRDEGIKMEGKIAGRPH